MKRFALVFFLLFLAVCSASAQVERAITVITTTVRLSPDDSAAKLTTLDRGRELVVLDRSRGWIKVEAEATGTPLLLRNDDTPEGRTVTGWMVDKGVIRPNTPNGDRVVFGEAADSEREASRRRGRRGAAQDAMRLYALLAEFMPSSPLAGEALFRAGDIQWQILKQEMQLRPSAKERDPYMREQLDDSVMKKVMKKYPGTKWADLAAYNLIDNKVCGDWQAQAKCPEKESDIYEKYAEEHSQSPVAAEALYNAAWRQAALIDIYKADDKPRKSEEAKAHAVSLCNKVLSQYSSSTDWSTNAQKLLYLIEQGVPTFGNQQ